MYRVHNMYTFINFIKFKIIAIILQTCKSVYDKIIDLRIATPQIVMNYGLFLEENNYFEEAFKVQINGLLRHILYLLYQHYYTCTCNAVFLAIVFFSILKLNYYTWFSIQHMTHCVSIILLGFQLLGSYKIFCITINLLKYCRHMRREQHCSSGQMYMTYGIPTLQSLWNDM